MEIQLDAGLLALVAALTIGLVEALKCLKELKDRPSWWPFLSVGIGVALTCLVMAGWAARPLGPVGQTIATWLIQGLAAGLSAAGLYSAGGGTLIDTALRR